MGGTFTHWKMLDFFVYCDSIEDACGSWSDASVAHSAFTISKNSLCLPCRRCKIGPFCDPFLKPIRSLLPLLHSFLAGKNNSVQLLSIADLKWSRFPCNFFAVSITQLYPGYLRAYAPMFRYLNAFLVVCAIVKLRVKSCWDLCWRNTTACCLTYSYSKKTLGMTCKKDILECQLQNQTLRTCEISDLCCFLLCL